MKDTGTGSMFSVLETTSKDTSAILSSDLRLVSSNEDVAPLLKFIEGNVVLAFDIETSGLSPFYDSIVGMSIANRQTGWYVAIGHRLDSNIAIPFVKTIIEALEDKLLVYHNSKFDWKFIYKKFGIRLPIAQDTYIMTALLDSDRIGSHGKLRLKNIVKEVFKVDMLELEDDLGTTDFSVVKHPDSMYYAAFDALKTFHLFEYLLPKIERNGLSNIYDVEVGIVPIIGMMELSGIGVDFEYVKKNLKTLEGIIVTMKREIESSGEGKFDIDSPQQCAEFLFDYLKIPVPFRGRSTDARILENLKAEHPIVAQLLEYRELSKLHTAFFSKIEDSVAEDSRVHSEFNSMGARSGRFTSSGGVGKAGQAIKVNMQQMPKLTKFNLRKAFVPREGFYWLKADYSQIEYRTMASLSGEKDLISAYAEGVDFHKKTASILLGKPLDKLTDEDRNKGKTLNFAISYGMSKYGLANALHIRPNEAEEMLNAYFENLGGLKQLMRNIKASAIEKKEVRTHFGRRRWFRDLPEKPEEQIKYLRKTFNTYIQGTAADIVKLGMFRLWNNLSRSGLLINPILTVHDEMDFEVSMDIPPVKAARVIKEAMEVTFNDNVTWTAFPVDVSIGPSFGEQYDLPDDYSTIEGKTYLEVIEPLGKPKEDKPVEVKKEEILKPSVILSGEYSPRVMKSLQELVAKNSGNYFVYLRLRQGGLFLLDVKYRINPTPTFMNQVQDLNFSIETNSDFALNGLSLDDFVKELS